MSATILDDRGVVLACPQCGQKNRLPYEHMGEEGICGRCHTALPPPSLPLELDQTARFDHLIRASAVPVVVDFWAPWCGPCKMMAPEIAKVAGNTGGKYLVAKVNTEALPDLARRYTIQSIPTLAVFHQGKELTRTMGARPAAAIEAFVREAIGRSV